MAFQPTAMKLSLQYILHAAGIHINMTWGSASIVSYNAPGVDNSVAVRRKHRRPEQAGPKKRKGYPQTILETQFQNLSIIQFPIPENIIRKAYPATSSKPTSLETPSSSALCVRRQLHAHPWRPFSEYDYTLRRGNRRPPKQNLGSRCCKQYASIYEISE